jgi:hypothetical protein
MVSNSRSSEGDATFHFRASRDLGKLEREQHLWPLAQGGTGSGAVPSPSLMVQINRYGTCTAVLMNSALLQCRAGSGSHAQPLRSNNIRIMAMRHGEADRTGPSAFQSMAGSPDACMHQSIDHTSTDDGPWPHRQAVPPHPGTNAVPRATVDASSRLAVHLWLAVQTSRGRFVLP